MNSVLFPNSIALFGTSADPPTGGHQTILRWLAQHYDLVVVWASDNPFKNHQTNLQNRSEMLGLIIGEIEPPKHNIILAQEISDRKTLITVEKAQQKWQNADFHLVIGSDLVRQIVTWFEVEKLLAKVKLIIIPRPDYELDKTNLAELKAVGGRYTIATLNPPRVSSSSYRLKGDRSAVTPAIQNYIQQKKLYS